MFDAHGELIYVGKAKRLRTRLLSYFRVRGRDRKAERILKCARAIAWEVVPSEFAALLRELELIHERQPRFNVRHHPGRRRHVYICLGRAPAPYVFTSRHPAASLAHVFGPAPGGAMLREAVRRINDGFRLRDCPRKQQMIFADQGRLFPEPLAAGCLRLEIGTCLGPCAAACSRPDYAAHVKKARAFLEGRDDALLQRLRDDMAKVAATQNYERAAALRDQLEAVQWLWNYLDAVRHARERFSLLYPVTGYDGRRLWYAIHQAKVMAVFPHPASAAAKRDLIDRIAGIYHPISKSAGLSLGELDAVQLLMAWFRKFPKEAQKCLRPEEFADLTTNE
jgi:excinuclease ABC subunit C